MNAQAKKIVESGEAILGLELGSTRIKAVLIDEAQQVIAQGIFDWENRFENGLWTYSLEQIDNGLAECYSSLCEDVKEKYGVELVKLKAIGISAMMHGYMVFDKDDRLLVPFRTWRNTTTQQAASELTKLFGFNIPQRWSVAHLYQAILNGEEHIDKIAYMTTLAGYIHYRLTGKKVIGVGEASGMFPIDSSQNDFDAEMVKKFDEKLAQKALPFTFKQIMPSVLSAGDAAGALTKEGAAFIDRSGRLSEGILLCPPEGDAGTGMCATNSVAERSGNVSAGTSVFAMIVMERPLARIHEEIDMVTTPSGKPVAMVHCNNCTCDIDAWAEVFGEFASVCEMGLNKTELYEKLFNQALKGEADCGGLLSYNYYSGEPVTKTDEGRAVMLHSPSSKFSLANFMRNLIYSSVATLAIGLDILFEDEKVTVDTITGHGGLFKTPVVAQQLLADAIGTSVTTMKTASEGGPWGMALLAAYMVRENKQETLEQYLTEHVFKNAESLTLKPDCDGKKGFAAFKERYIKGLPIENAAIKNF